MGVCAGDRQEIKMKIEIRKYSSKPNMLVCVREDGSTAWQSYGNQSNFFPYHDLTHFVVETELGFWEGFYGMISAGRSIEETGVDVPDGAQVAESLAGLLSTVGAQGAMTFEEVKAVVDQQLADIGLPPVELSEVQLSIVRTRCAELFLQWQELEDGDSLRLDFPDKLKRK